MREHERLVLVDKQIATIEAEREAECRKAARQAERREAAPRSNQAKIVQLTQLKSVGVLPQLRQPPAGRRLRRADGNALFEHQRDQGISKAGNPRARTTAVELAWRWVYWQPDSALTRWFKARVGDAKGRVRRIAIVALARKLMVALWRYLETGVVPEGAVLHPSF